MKRLWVCAALAPLSFAAVAHAQQTISTATTAPVTTSAAAGDITLTTAGSITPTTAGTATQQAAAVTANTNNNVSNAGILSYTGLNYTTGILGIGVAPGSALVALTNTGTISNIENTGYKDTNGDYINDTNGSNPIGVDLFAAGTNRFGMATSGTLAYNGSIANSGTITIIGENSAGIAVGAAGINGDLDQTGTITVTGGNPSTSDVSYGVYAAGRIGGSVIISGTVSALGQNATGVALDGGVGGVGGGSGFVEVNATISSTGYESTSPYQISSLQSLVQAQAAEELLQGGPALRIQGAVTGGISLDAPIIASGTTAAVAGATITSSGSAPAVQIGGTAPTIISPITTASAGTITASVGFGMVVGGVLSGDGIYAFNNLLQPVDATGLAIGAVGAPSVTLNGGLSITGSVTASTTGAAVTTTTDPTTGALVTSNDTGTGNPVALSINNATLTLNTQQASTTVLGAITVSGLVSAAAETQTIAGTSASNIGSPGGTKTTGPQTINPVQATAIQLGPQANVASLVNMGTIEASITGLETTIITAGGGTQGYATAISDQSGSLKAIVNENTIAARVLPLLPNQLIDSAYSDIVAIDLRDNTSGAIISQISNPTLTAVDATTGLTTVVVPTISGDVLFGSGSGTLNLAAGALVGGVQFGASPNNAINITGGAVALGAIAETAGGELAVNVQSGVLGIEGPVTNELQTTAYATTHTEPPAIPAPPTSQVAIGVSSVNIGSTGNLTFSVYAPAAAAPSAQVGAPQFNVGAGGVTVAAGGGIGLNFLTKLTQSAVYDVIESTGAINLADPATALGQLPFLYQGAISTSTASNGENLLAITVSRKSLAQLGLNPAQSSAFEAFYAAFDKTDLPGEGDTSGDAIGSVPGTVLSQTSKADFDHLYNQFLPDYSGGAFDTMVMGQDALASAEADTSPKLQGDGPHGWVQEIGFAKDRNSADVVGYSGKGFGIAGGTENVSGRSAVGVAMALLSTSVNDTGRPVGSTQTASAVEAGVYWREGGDGLNLSASLNGGWVFLQGHRILLEQTGSDNATFLREAKASWNGGIAASTVDVSYKANLGRFFLKPEALAEYILLYESAYSETGAGDAVDLAVNSKLSQEGVVQGDMMLGANFGTVIQWTPSMTIGWRQIVAGGPANTTAHFSGGQSFTLSPNYQDETTGLLARLGLRASGQYADFSANAGGVFNKDYNSVDARATARFLF